jgi:hypothetical protein
MLSTQPFMGQKASWFKFHGGEDLRKREYIELAEGKCNGKYFKNAMPVMMCLMVSPIHLGLWGG